MSCKDTPLGINILGSLTTSSVRGNHEFEAALFPAKTEEPVTSTSTIAPVEDEDQWCQSK